MQTWLCVALEWTAHVHRSLSPHYVMRYEELLCETGKINNLRMLVRSTLNSEILQTTICRLHHADDDLLLIDCCYQKRFKRRFEFIRTAARWTYVQILAVTDLGEQNFQRIWKPLRLEGRVRYRSLLETIPFGEPDQKVAGYDFIVFKLCNHADEESHFMSIREWEGERENERQEEKESQMNSKTEYAINLSNKSLTISTERTHSFWKFHRWQFVKVLELLEWMQWLASFSYIKNATFFQVDICISDALFALKQYGFL